MEAVEEHPAVFRQVRECVPRDRFPRHPCGHLHRAPLRAGLLYLVTMGMNFHRMNVPEELAEYKLERAEAAIALPADWKLDQRSMKDEKWYWPIRLLKSLARLPINCDSWLGHGHTVENREPFADNTKLCTAT
ncbi:MAG: suppressor of fused domain protein [Flavonifractor plautii]